MADRQIPLDDDFEEEEEMGEAVQAIQHVQSGAIAPVTPPLEKSGRSDAAASPKPEHLESSQRGGKNLESSLRSNEKARAGSGEPVRVPSEEPNMEASTLKTVNYTAQESVPMKRTKIVSRKDVELPVNFVLEKLLFRVDSTSLYIDLAIFVPFLIMFVFFFLAGRDLESNFFVLKSISDRMMNSEFPDTAKNVEIFNEFMAVPKEPRFQVFLELDKTFWDIGNAQDWGWWLRYSLMPRIWDCKNPDATYQVLQPAGLNVHIGAMRVREIRTDPYSCEVEEDRYGSMNKTILRDTCYRRHKKSREQTNSPRCNITNPMNPNEQLYQYRTCDDVPGAPTKAIEELYHCGGYQYEVPFNASCNSVTPLMDLMVNDNSGCNFADNWATRFVIVEFFVYSIATDTFHSIKLLQEVFAGGWWFNQFQFRSFQVWTEKNLDQTIFDFFFFAFVLYYWFDFLRELVGVCKEHGSPIKFFVEFWNILELANLVTFLVVFAFRWSWWADSDASKPRFPFDAKYPPDLDRIRVQYDIQVYANSVNIILTFVKLLKYVRLNNRLNVLTRTLADCQQSIFGVLVLFVFVLLGYAITAWMLFGINMEGFRNLGVSMSSLMRMLVGDIDYEAMKRENRYLAGMFFWSFVILALFLLLNFLIAIISESFANVSGTTHVQPLDQAFIRMVQEWKAYLRPANLGRMIKLRLRGRSSDSLLRIALKDVAEHRDIEAEKLRELLKLEAEIVDDVEVHMKRSHWDEWVRADVMADLGPYYFDITWEELQNEYDEFKKTAESVSRRAMSETVERAIEKFVGEDMNRVDDFDATLTNLESEVAKIMSQAASMQNKRR